MSPAQRHYVLILFALSVVDFYVGMEMGCVFYNAICM